MSREVLSALPELSKTELEEVRKRCSALLGVSAKINSELQIPPLGEDLWPAAIGQLRISHKGRGAPKAAPHRRSQRETQALISAAENLEEWLGANLGDGWKKAPKVKKLSILNLIVRCISTRLSKENEPCSLLRVLEALSDRGLLETALDDAFPGYLGSGMIHMLAEV